MSDAHGFQPRPRQADNTPSASDMSPKKDAWGNPLPEDNNGSRQRVNDRSGDNPNDKNLNNDGIDDADIDTIWEAVKKKTTTDDDTNNNNNNNNNNQPDPKKQLEDYMTSIGLEPLALSDAEKEEMKNGEFGNVLAKMNDKIRNAHLKAMSGSKTMIDAAVAQAMRDAKSEANSTFQGQMNLTALHSALPFTKDKAIGPVAQTVMQKFLDRGLTTEDAIDGVRRWFAKTSQAFEMTNVNKNRNGNFSGARPNSTDNDAPEGGWLKILRGQGN